jgi:hypothetical protein
MLLLRVTIAVSFFGVIAQGDAAVPSAWNAMAGKVPIVITQAANEPALSSPPKVSLEMVTVPQGSVQDLLVSRGIVPDDDAYLLVFELNPTLASLRSLTPGIRITLPKIGQGGPSHRFKIRVDPETRSSITSCREALSGEVSDQNLSAKSLEDEAEREQFRKNILDIRHSMSDFSLVAQDNSTFLSEAILTQLLAECQYVEAVLGTKSTLITKEQVNRISLVKRDLELKRSNINEQRGPGELPSRWLDTIVSVNTTANGVTISHLRVCWAAQALMDVPGQTHALAQVSSPAEDILPEADYVFWAAEDVPTAGQQCVKRLSAPLEVEVRKNGSAKKVVDLTVEAHK